jgi:dual oxidase
MLYLLHFTAIGNPRGDENPFLLSFGILWFRVHQYWAKQLRNSGLHELAEEDEWLFNRARQFTIATYQHIVYDEWLPLFLPRKYSGGRTYPYNATEGYSAYFGRLGYNQAINPQVPHIFQSAAMRWGHTVVTPGIWRRELV